MIPDGWRRSPRRLGILDTMTSPTPARGPLAVPAADMPTADAPTADVEASEVPTADVPTADVPVATEPWDLVVVGGGTAGMLGARTAVGLGARVLLIESDRTGGDCLWTGCVPSKALQAAAAAAADARRAHRFGVDVGEVRVDFPRVMQHVHAAIAAIAPVDSPEALEAAGVRVCRGRAVFTGPDTVSVGRGALRFRQALVATGAGPSLPPLTGLGEVDTLTTDTVWELTALPGRLVVIGGGSTGCELGQAFARLGSAVTIVESGARVLAGEDFDASAAVAASLTADGVTVLIRSTAARVERVGDGGVLQLAHGARVEFDALLVATGRRPRTDGLALETAGVLLGNDGTVRVNAHLGTSNPRIWAAGDVTGHPRYTHTAGVHGTVAAFNAFLGPVRRVDSGGEPRVTFTRPEVAAVGRSSAGRGGTVISWPHDKLDRGIAEGATAGFTRLMIDRRGRVVGATVVGPRAGETIGELAVAVAQKLTTSALAGVTHPYPTHSDGAWNAAVADFRGRLGGPLAKRALWALSHARRWWVRRG